MNIQSLLRDIDNMKVRETYVRITLLSFSNEMPIKTIDGKVISGSINIDGTSAVRRTANLEVLIEEDESNVPTIQRDISINKKVKIEIGIKNNLSISQKYDLNNFLMKYDTYNTDSHNEYENVRKLFHKKNNFKYKNLEYQDNIFWFNQGVYIIKSASFSRSLSNTTASLSLVDKMALLDGTCGGVLPATTVFHELEDIGENGEIIIRKPTIYQIIQELVHHIGKEQLGKIIINLDTKIKQVMRWSGYDDLYLVVGKTVTEEQTSQAEYKINNDSYDEENENQYIFNTNDDVGFIVTDFTYPDELIGKPGDTIVSILDQIKNTLGNYEYFYDVNGFFCFREIQNYLNITRASSAESNNANQLYNNINGQSYNVHSLLDKSEYDFNNSNLLVSYSNSPSYENIKNDFIVWGMKKVNGSSFPIRYHVAIDGKPTIEEKQHDIVIYDDPQENVKKIVTPTQIQDPSPTNKNLNYFYWYSGITYKRMKLFSGKPPLTDPKRQSKNTIYYITNSENYQYYTYNSDTPLSNIQEITSTNYHQVAENYFTDVGIDGPNEVYIVIRRGNEVKNCYRAQREKRVVKYVHQVKQVEIIQGIPPMIGRKTNAIYYQLKNPAPLDNSEDRYEYYDVYSENFPIQEDNIRINNNNNISFENLYQSAQTFEDFLKTYYVIQKNNDVPIRAYKYQLYEPISAGITKITPKDWRSELLLQGCDTLDKGLEANEYYAELTNEWPKIYDLEEEKFIVTENDLDYFLDFLDMPKYQQFSIENIGKRTKILNNDQINCIFETEIPEIIMIDTRDNDQNEKKEWARKHGYRWTQVSPKIYDHLSIGGIKNSAFEAMKDLLYQNLSYNSSISLESIPIYYLEPNTRISVEDKMTNISGDYMITSISYSFGDKATMSIQANEALERIF